MRMKAWAGSMAAVVLVGIATPASARDWPDTAGWSILEGDDYCGMTVEYQGKGDTQLTVGKFLDGHALLMLTNNGWSAKKDQEYDIQYYVNKKAYVGKAHGVEADYSRKGFTTRFGLEFFKDFAQGSGLKAYIGETLVDSLDLDGTAAAMVTVDRCLASVRATNAAVERERRRFDHIPDDPFASQKAKPAPDEAAPESQWISVDDYPPSSLRAVEEGTTTIAYTVNGQGRVENCVIKASSGSAALDRATCQAITRRGRFAPKTDSSGQAVSYERAFSYTWKQPRQS